MNLGRAVGGNHQPQRPAATGKRPLARQIVTLGFLSEELPSRLIAERIAGSLVTETQAPVILVRFDTKREGGHVVSPATPEVYLNGEFHLPPELLPTPGGFHLVTITVRGEPPSPAGLDSLVGQLGRFYRHVLIEVPINRPPEPWIIELLKRSELAFLFLKLTTEDVYHLE